MEEKRGQHPLKARAFVALLMLMLAFMGLVVTDMDGKSALSYWQVMVPVFAVLSLLLSWYIRHKTKALRPITMWHELLHWVGLALSTLLVWFFVRIGILGRFEAGLMVLTLLALTTFLVGIYVDYSFLVIGLMLGCFAAAAGFVTEYLFSVMLPLTLLVGILLYLYIRGRHKKEHSSEE